MKPDMYDVNNAVTRPFIGPSFSLPEMTPEQQKQLIEIRKKKQELLLEIQVSRFNRFAF